MKMIIDNGSIYCPTQIATNNKHTEVCGGLQLRRQMNRANKNRSRKPYISVTICSHLYFIVTFS